MFNYNRVLVASVKEMEDWNVALPIQRSCQNRENGY
jgi:hypothetical protein